MKQLSLYRLLCAVAYTSDAIVELFKTAIICVVSGLGITVSSDQKTVFVLVLSPPSLSTYFYYTSPVISHAPRCTSVHLICASKIHDEDSVVTLESFLGPLGDFGTYHK